MTGIAKFENNDVRKQGSMEKEDNNPLRLYQTIVSNAIRDSVENKKGMTFSIEISRQGGKNELSAYIEAALLGTHMHEAVNIIKCSPTFEPQAKISIDRLKERLDYFEFDWEQEKGYIIRLGLARAIFLSADGSSNVVGNTAHLLLEVDEAQDVSRDKRHYQLHLRPLRHHLGR
jgi:hypothetical protein